MLASVITYFFRPRATAGLTLNFCPKPRRPLPCRPPRSTDSAAWPSVVSMAAFSLW